MNLNISTQFVNNFQGNDAEKSIKLDKCEFEGIFEILEGIEGEFNIDLNNKENNKDSIDYDLLQNILNNIKIIDFNQINNLKGDTSLSLEEVEGKSKNQLDIIKQIGNLLKSSRIDESPINNEIKLNDSEIKLDNNEFYAFIKQKIEDGTFDNKEIIKLKNALEKSPILDKDLIVSKDNLKIETTNIENKLKQEVNNLEEYKKLEVSSLSNKNNIIKNTVQHLNAKDKDLNTLESILDKKDVNNPMFLNNNVNSANLENSIDTKSKQMPVNNIRQEFLGEDIVKTVKYLKSNGLEEIKIKITPRELGDMTIRFIKDHEEAKVLITVQKEDVFNMVNKNLGDITKHLSDLNIKVKDVQVDIKNDDQKFFLDDFNQGFDKKNQEEKQQQKSKYRNMGIENIEETTNHDKLEENINILI